MKFQFLALFKFDLVYKKASIFNFTLILDDSLKLTVAIPILIKIWAEADYFQVFINFQRHIVFKFY